MKRVFLSFLFLFQFPVLAEAVPTVTKVTCKVDYRLRNNSGSRGALAERRCILMTGFNYIPYFSLQERFVPEQMFSCKLKENETACIFSKKELDFLNETIATYGTPYFMGTRFTDRSNIEDTYGCIQASSENNGVSPRVHSSNPPDGGVTSCKNNEPCELQVSYRYLCFSLPTASVAKIQQCREDYQNCFIENAAWRTSLGICTGEAQPIGVQADLGTTLKSCQQHLDACRTHNFQLGNTLAMCES